MRIVIALGGNALGNSAFQQLSLVKETVKPLADLIEEGHEIIVTHGNGPQVGMINLAMEVAKEGGYMQEMPFAECGAMSQGYIGYHLQNALRQELKNRAIKKEVVSLVTQVLVDVNDDAFKDPTKPIGNFYSEEKAQELAKQRGYVIKEDAGRGYRRVIASPKPLDVIEKQVIIDLVDKGVVVICVGGGGIPVVESGSGYQGVDGVIDKDFASAKLAEIVQADYLIILTAVDNVMINYNKPDAKVLYQLTIDQAKQYIEEGHFAAGSMLPKVQAAVSFVSSGTNRVSLIASLAKAKQALKGESGTKIIN